MTIPHIGQGDYWLDLFEKRYDIRINKNKFALDAVNEELL